MESMREPEVWCPLCFQEYFGLTWWCERSISYSRRCRWKLVLCASGNGRAMINQGWMTWFANWLHCRSGKLCYERDWRPETKRRSREWELERPARMVVLRNARPNLQAPQPDIDHDMQVLHSSSPIYQIKWMNKGFRSHRGLNRPIAIYFYQNP